MTAHFAAVPGAVPGRNADGGRHWGSHVPGLVPEGRFCPRYQTPRYRPHCGQWWPGPGTRTTPVLYPAGFSNAFPDFWIVQNAEGHTASTAGQRGRMGRGRAHGPPRPGKSHTGPRGWQRGMNGGGVPVVFPYRCLRFPSDGVGASSAPSRPSLGIHRARVAWAFRSSG